MQDNCNINVYLSQSGAFIHNSYEIDIKCFTTDVDIEKSNKHLIIYKFTLQFLYKKVKRNNGQINTNKKLNLY